MKKILPLTLVFCLLLFTAAKGQVPKVATIGQPAPDFLLMDHHGNAWKLSELKGRVVFLYFWASWCPPCRSDIVSLQRLHEMMPEDSFTMLAISSDTPALTDKFVKKLGLTMPILYDPNVSVSIKYRLTTLPHTMILDKQGVIREKFTSFSLWDSPELKKRLMGYINQ